jgi:CDP-glucose 4,6-dehydratase
MKSVIGDIRVFSEVQAVINRHQPEIIFHMAAQPLVRYSYREPIETYATNVLGTVHLFEAARLSTSVKTIINVTTDKCYENQEWPWGYRENDRLGGHDPYSNSKACAELVTTAYRNSFFTNSNIGLASVRAGNVIGGGDWAAERLIPDIIQGCMKSQEIVIRNPNAIRPWQHVLEPLSGYLLLAEKLYKSPSQYAQSWNFGPEEDDVKTVGWIADYITNDWGNGNRWVKETTIQPYEAIYLKLDCSKAKTALCWRPRWKLEEALQQTVQWYQAYQSKKNLYEITLNQVENFINSLS